ncbi:MAG: RNA polymerase sigma factor [Gemmatimonadales bacterium]|jgi:RNA polymerase sigma-70 factor (ECF subfamily)|nr:MAG: RNA polymerase sigma factor [Gemmatimonadales bacterium]
MSTTSNLAVNPSPTDEARDVRLAVGGDARAFERIYRSTVPKVHSLARRLAGEALAEDLTQEVYLRAWSRLHTFRGEARFGTWLHRLAVNLILSRRETLRKHEAREVIGEGFLERMAGRVGLGGLSMDFEKAMATLPGRARDVFVLHDVEGYTHDEIAEMMGISAGTSKSQLHRARMLLRRVLDR